MRITEAASLPPLPQLIWINAPAAAIVHATRAAIAVKKTPQLGR
jgi:hypothetical protein